MATAVDKLNDIVARLERIEGLMKPAVPPKFQMAEGEMADLKVRVATATAKDGSLAVTGGRVSVEKPSDGYDVWRVPLGRIDPDDPGSPTHTEWAAVLAQSVGGGRDILIVPQVYMPGMDGPVDAGWQFSGTVDATAFAALKADVEAIRRTVCGAAFVPSCSTDGVEVVASGPLTGPCGSETAVTPGSDEMPPPEVEKSIEAVAEDKPAEAPHGHGKKRKH